MTRPLVIYHADRTDGFGAAFAAWLKLGDGAEYLPMQYGQDYSKSENTFPVKDREVYIFDFSFPRKVMDFLFAQAKCVVWLDHHRTAFEMWCDSYQGGMPCFPYQGERNFCKMYNQGNNHSGYILLDNSKSGAMLAWEYFHPGAEVPLLIQHIDDRERWQFKLEGSKELHAALASYRPWSFEQWKMGLDVLSNAGVSDLVDEGEHILRAQNAAVAQAVKHARKCVIGVCPGAAHKDMRHYAVAAESFTGLAVSCPLHQSEIGHELANKSGTFGLVWYMDKDGRINVSLRSNGDYDVSAIATAFSGGGHKNAAGFQTGIQTLLGWLK